MPTQQQYSDAILRAQVVNAQDGLELINREMSGCDCNWSNTLCNFRQINGALTCFSIADYTSATAVYFYNLMLKIGAPYREDIDIDTNFQAPGIIIIVEGTGPIPYYFDQNDLILDTDTGTWYLEYKDPDGDTITTTLYNVQVIIDGHVYPVSAYYENDISWDFPRIYGFSPDSVIQQITIYTI